MKMRFRWSWSANAWRGPGECLDPTDGYTDPCGRIWRSSGLVIDRHGFVIGADAPFSVTQ
jgi:hypothetical protein